MILAKRGTMLRTENLVTSIAALEALYNAPAGAAVAKETATLIAPYRAFIALLGVRAMRSCPLQSADVARYAGEREPLAGLQRAKQYCSQIRLRSCRRK